MNKSVNKRVINFVNWQKAKDISFSIIGWTGVMLIILWIIGYIQGVLFIILIAFLISYLLNPLVSSLKRFIPVVLAVSIVYLGIILIVLLFLSLTLSRIMNESSSLIVFIRKYTLANNIKIEGISIKQSLEYLLKSVPSAASISSAIFPFINNIFDAIFDFIVIIVLSIYFSMNGEKVAEWLKYNSIIFSPKDINNFLKTLSEIIGGYFKGQFIMAIIVGILVSIGMEILRVPYPILIGLIAFFLEFIPIIGALISGGIAILLSLSKGYLLAIFTLSYFIGVHILEGDILGPRIVGKAIHIHPIISLIAIVAGVKLFAILGALFAPPFAALIQVFAINFWKYLEKRLGSYNPAK